MQKFNRLVDKLVCLECRYPAACANYDQLQISLVRHQSERMNGKIDLGCGGWGGLYGSNLRRDNFSRLYGVRGHLGHSRLFWGSSSFKMCSSSSSRFKLS